MAAVLKTARGASSSWVRIPRPPLCTPWPGGRRARPAGRRTAGPEGPAVLVVHLDGSCSRSLPPWGSISSVRPRRGRARRGGSGGGVLADGAEGEADEDEDDPEADGH